MEESGQLGTFDVGEQIGEGGMGAVYRGSSRETGVPVAIKIIHRATDRRARRQFHREVQAHAGLRHPAVVYLFEYGKAGSESDSPSDQRFRPGSPYVVMELAERGTVREAMPMHGWGAVYRLLRQILAGLAHAHARGVIHRDLKPENFL
ncbi:MAG: protein kinase, partial [Bradymonadaceae bacterium]